MTEQAWEQESAVERALRAAFLISADVGRETQRLVAEGRANPLSESEAKSLLRKIVTTMKRAAARRGDQRTLAQLSGDPEEIVDRVMNSKRRAADAPNDVHLSSNGVNGASGANGSAPPAPGPRVVAPSPVFHGRRVHMYEERMAVRDINLWVENERLDIHLEQFRTLNGRAPTNDEMLDLMHGALLLPGVTEEDKADPFEIEDLAESIVKNGVRRAPILDSDGESLLDGNRRIAACYYVLNSPDYSPEDKKQAEQVTVWRLTEHADDEDRQAVIVSLNFEDDCKLIWPDYVRARKVAFDYESMRLRIGERNIDKKKDLEIRKGLARKYALKPQRVSLYLQMVQWADKFEEYHVETKKRDLHEVRHFANKKFSYFKELSDGLTKDDGVARILSEDPEFRGLVFDLLFQGRFKNWESIRMLRHRDDPLERELREAHDEKDPEIGKRNVTLALNAAYQRAVDKRRSIGADQTIQSFFKFLSKLPPEAYLDANTVSTESLHSLVTLCSMALKNAEEALKARGETLSYETGT